MKFTLLPKPAIAFLPRHLHFQLALLTSAALLITFIAYEWHSANHQSEFAQNGVKQEALALARNIAVTGSDFIVSKDFAGLEDLLVRTIDLPAVLGVRVTNRQGKLLSDVAKKADGTPVVRFSSQAISVPSDVGAVSRVDYIRPASGWRYEFGLGDPGRMVVWQPVISGTLLGWVVVDYSMASSAEIRRRIWSDSLVAIAIAILVSILLLLLLRLGTTQAKFNNQAASLLAHEQLLQSVLDTALDAFIRINAQGQVTDWNLQAERMFGYSRADAVGNVSKV